MIEITRRSNGAGSSAVKVKIIGVGGAGSNALDRLVLDGVADAELVAMNTDVQALTASVAATKVQLGRSVTRGLGAGGDPEVGTAAADEAIEEIRAALEGASLVFVCAGLGGGTGSGAAPLVAQLASEAGALVVVVATLPFAFEGKRRGKQALDALAAMQFAADAVICFENDRMGESVSPRAGVHQAFVNADQTISQSVRAVCDLIQNQGLIHIGFDDLVSALRNNNARTLFGFGVAEGENRAHEALERALKNPLMDRGRILNETHNVLVSVTGGPNMTLSEVQVLMDEFGRHVDDQTRILFGVGVDATMGSRMSVTIISSMALATGITAVGTPANLWPKAAREPAPAAVAETLAAIGASWESPDAGQEEEGELVAVAAGTNDPAFEFSEAEAESEPAPISQPGPVHVAPPQIRSAPAIQSAPAAAQVAPKPAQERQETLQFEPVTRGRFEKSEPTIVGGEDLDVPTFLRKNVRVTH